MRQDQKRQLAMFERVERFIESNADRCSRARASGTYADLCADLAAVRHHLADRRTVYEDRRTATRHFHELRAALLRDHMAPLARIAAAAADARPAPPYLRMPPRWARPLALLEHARGMAAQAGTNADQFLRAGLPAGFDERLVAAAEALGQCVFHRERLSRSSAAHTRLLGERIKHGGAAVQVLDAMIRSEGAGDPSLMAAWREVVRVGGRERRRMVAAGGAGTSLIRVARPLGDGDAAAEWTKRLHSMVRALAGVWRQVRIPRLSSSRARTST